MNTPDLVNKPPHYNSHPSGVECIEITEHMNFCLGNATKYIWRAGLKNDDIEDLKKARWYLDREIARRELRRALPVPVGEATGDAEPEPGDIAPGDRVRVIFDPAFVDKEFFGRQGTVTEFKPEGEHLHLPASTIPVKLDSRDGSESESGMEFLFNRQALTLLPDQDLTPSNE